jgi:Fe-S oxidoreductase
MPSGLKRVEMDRCRDRSFCCGGGGLMLFYEPEEEQRMGVLRVEMAAEAGANVIVTACPFCLVNMEDAIKVAGLEGRWKPSIWQNWSSGSSPDRPNFALERRRRRCIRIAAIYGPALQSAIYRWTQTQRFES